MAAVALVGRDGMPQWRLSSLLIASLFALNAALVSGLSVSAPFINGRRSTHHVAVHRAASLFPTLTRRSNGLVVSGLAAVDISSSDGQSWTNISPKKRILLALSKLSHHIIQLRRNLLRALAILSFILLGYTKSMISPAHAAWGSKTDTVEVATTTKSDSSYGKKFVKLVVTGGAVASGAVTANRVRSLDNDGTKSEDDGILKVVPKDKPSPLPLPTTQQQVHEEQKPPAKITSKTLKPATTPGISKGSILNKSNPALVKDLESKI